MEIPEILKFLECEGNDMRLRFYDRLAFNLTIAIRSIAANPETNDTEKLEAVKIINELSHRIFNWIWSIRKNDIGIETSDCFSIIEHYASLNKEVAGELSQAITSSFQNLSNR